MNEPLKPCRSPYCECEQGHCTHPGFYDARHEPWPPTASPTGRLAQTEPSLQRLPIDTPEAKRLRDIWAKSRTAPGYSVTFSDAELQAMPQPYDIVDGRASIKVPDPDSVQGEDRFKLKPYQQAMLNRLETMPPNLQQIPKGSDPARGLFKYQPYQREVLKEAPDSETPEVEALRAAIHTLQQAWEDTRTQRDELLAHIKDGAPLPEWAAKWIATFAGQSHTRAYTQRDPKPVIGALRELADLLESGRLVYGSGGLSFSGSQESATLNANLTLKRQPKG